MHAYTFLEQNGSKFHLSSQPRAHQGFCLLKTYSRRSIGTGVCLEVGANKRCHGSDRLLGLFCLFIIESFEQGVCLHTSLTMPRGQGYTNFLLLLASPATAIVGILRNAQAFVSPASLKNGLSWRKKPQKIGLACCAARLAWPPQLFGLRDALG